MWTTKEVVIISIATGLAFSFATIYSQRKLNSYVNQKIEQQSVNPLLGIVPSVPVQNNTHYQHENTNAPVIQQSYEPIQQKEPIQHKVRYHTPPDGAGTRWTPLPIS